MSQNENAFGLYLQKCKDLHEEWHPGARYNEEEFQELAIEAWNTASEAKKDNVRSRVKNENETAKPSQGSQAPSIKASPFLGKKRFCVLHILGTFDFRKWEKFLTKIPQNKYVVILYNNERKFRCLMPGPSAPSKIFERDQKILNVFKKFWTCSKFFGRVQKI